MFAGSMIGIVLLAVLLEFLRRSVKEFDKYLVKQHIKKHRASFPITGLGDEASGNKNATMSTVAAAARVPPFRPTF